MSNLNGEELRITASLGQYGRFRIVAGHNGDTFVDEVKLLSRADRDAVAKVIGQKFPQWPPAEIQRRLDHLAAEAARMMDRPPEEKPDDSGFKVADVPAWPDPVDLREVLDEARSAAAEHLYATAEILDSVALWSAFTHVFNCFDTCPIFAILSPLKRCGKTTCLSILSRLVARPLAASNISSAALFRVIEQSRPTLMIDEADAGLIANEELRGLLNSGHTQDAAFVLRVNPDSLAPERFSTWAPKCIAAIGALSDTVMDRAIVARLDRKPKHERRKRLTRSARERLAEIGSKLARWSMDHADGIDAEAEPATPESLNDRAADNWRPLFILADLAGGRWPEAARRAAMILCGEDEDAAEPGVRLLAFIRDWLGDRGDVEMIETSTLLEALHGDDEWKSYGRSGKPITSRTVSRLLKPFGIKPMKTRTIRGYSVKELEAAIERYCSLSSKYAPQAPQAPQDDANPDSTSTYDDTQSATQAPRGGSDDSKRHAASADSTTTYGKCGACGACGASKPGGENFFSGTEANPPEGNRRDADLDDVNARLQEAAEADGGVDCETEVF
ncbi:MAG: DUF3631 domain-containing protein [Thermogutta sp.]|nr:DUF3631 domain-containing protein [Thermogutta sp.]